MWIYLIKIFLGQLTLTSETVIGRHIHYGLQMFDMTSLLYVNVSQNATMVTDFKQNVRYVVSSDGHCSYQMLK